MTYLEAIEDDSRCGYQFDMTGGSGRCFYHTPIGSGFDLQVIVQDILGYTRPFANGSQQNLSRVLPATHPKCAYLYAHRITSIVGKGSGTATQTPPTMPTNPAIGSNPVCSFFNFQQWEIGVDFASRPYPVIADDAFTTTVNGRWFTKNGTQNDFTYAPEFVRFVDWDYFPQDNTIQGQQGQLALWGLPTAGGKSVPFTSPPWQFLPDQLIKMRLFQYPFRYITSSNSYIAGGPNRNWRGRVNQNPFLIWSPGQLMYLGYSVHKYTPPTTDIGTYLAFLPNSDDLNATGPFINYERLCDIELTFLQTNRFMSGTLGAPISNRNFVSAGHNLLPVIGGQNTGWFYATRNPTDLQSAPAWYSAPFEILFSDPDAAGGPTTTGDN